MIWYKEKIEKLYEILETSEKGLSKKEVADRINKYGENQLAIKKDSIWKIILEPFKSVFVGVLIVAAIVSALSHEVLDAIIILVIIVVNSIIYYSQQYATTRVLRSLKKHSIQQVSVIRDGQEQTVSSVNLVPGDIVILNEGERIPADARVVHTDNLQVNESSLTGESVPVHKHASTLEADKEIYEQDNMVFQGTYVLSGDARVVVVETGSSTEFCKIAFLASDEKDKSPVQEKIDYLITLLVKVVAVIAVVVFALSLARGIPSGEALRFVLSLTVSAVPEGLPVALTVIIVLGMRRMAKQKALVSNFQAIEDIGLVTTIVTDKTGTLTKNHLTIVESWSVGESRVEDVMKRTIDSSVSQVDPLDQAIKEGVKSHHKIDKMYPFDLVLRMSGAYSSRNKAVYIKGSPEHILALSKVSAKQRSEAESEMHKMASKGYRVIAFGVHNVSNNPPADLGEIKSNDINFVGFVAFADELRKESKRAIHAAHQAGVSVRLVTGDHYETAYNIGKTIDLADHPDQVIQGTDLPENKQALITAIKNKTVFARILPEDKFRILKALKESGQITAMTGDGVNDVPALASAHVGIAMGSGSDIARDAGGIVLLNDNFVTIIRAVSEGRRIFDNIRRMLFYLLSTSLGEVLTMVGALMFGLPLPVTAIQILWINLVTDTALVLPLGLEPEEDGHMKRPPRNPKSPLLSRMLLNRMLIISLTMAVVTLVIGYVLHQQGKDIGYIQTVSFMALVVAQWMNVFNARSEYESSFSRIKKTNKWLVVGFAVAFVLQALVMFGPLADVFGVQTVSVWTILLTSGIMSIAVLMVSEIHKLITRKMQDK